MSNKTSDKNVGSIEEDIKIVKEFIDYAQEVIDDMEYERPVDVTVYQKYLTSMQNILAEREQMLKAINTVEKEKGDWIKAYQEEKDSQFDLLKRIQELEEQVKMLDEAYTGTIKESKKWFDIAHNSIPTQVVIDKIEKLKEVRKIALERKMMSSVESFEIAIGHLEELLEGGK